MNTPPLLLGATLFFWGWQTGFLAVGIVMGVLLECPRWFRLRWELTNEDFVRIRTFCTLLALAAFVYAFTSNEGFVEVRRFFENPRLLVRRSAGAATSHSAAAFFRWLPMTLFLFVAGQAWSGREGLPLRIMSPLLQRRWKRAKKAGKPPPPEYPVNTAYPYFGLVVFSTSIHTSDDAFFFWGLCVLVTWALWPMRSPRFGLAVWVAVLAVAMTAGYMGQRSIGQLQGLLTNYNPSWWSSLLHGGTDANRSQTAIGSIGRLKSSTKIVIRVEADNDSEAPSYLREASYRMYSPPKAVWSAGSARDSFERVNADKDVPTTFDLVPNKTNVCAARISCYLSGGEGSLREGVLPLPRGTGRLEDIPAYDVRVNNLGVVMVQGPGLVIFDALYGPGATADSPPDSRFDWEVPLREEPALDRVISDLKLSGLSTNEIIKRVAQFFQERFVYSTWLTQPNQAGGNQTAVGDFLLHTHQGHCEYFATATVLLLRELGIPARYAVGYLVHEGANGKYVVRERDAHAWCLVWRDGTWRDFDTTPAVWVADESEPASLWQSISDGWSRLWFEFSKFRWGQSQLREYLFLALLPALALLLWQTLRRGRGRLVRRKMAAPRPATAWPGLDSEFYQLETKLAERGVPRAASEPLSAWLARAATATSLADRAGAVRRLLQLHYRHRFDPEGLSAGDREALRFGVRACLVELSDPSRQ
jgi:protein-glutamine gamma-glutamyltransferase